MRERSEPGKVTRSGAATASGGVANSGIHYGDVNIQSGAPVRTRYLEQVERVAPPELRGRDAELAELAQFCTASDTAGTYAWWRAPAWSGKSALMSWFVLHPPCNVRIVSFFVTARLASQNDRRAFTDNVLEQLLAMLGEDLPPLLTEATRDAHLLGLLDEAAEACRDRGEELVLLVDGLDEDRGVGTGPDAHSIAALLPARPQAGMRVVVAGRPNPPIPGEVPAHHPLRDEAIVRPLDPSPEAQAIHEEMERDLLRLLEGTAGEQDLLGLVAAAGGGLSAADLAELTGWSQWEISRRLRTVAGRSFSVRGSEFRPCGPEVLLLGHEELQVTALDMFGPARLARYRERLHAWAQQYRARRWPDGTPEYLLRGYFRMLHAVGDTENMVALVTDPDRQNRMLDLSGGDAAALSEITTALDVLAGQENPDLITVLRLAMHRDHLSDRNNNMPTELPAVWARLGQFHRAESLADSLPVHHRVTALVGVARAVTNAGDQQRARCLLERAEATARSGSDYDENVGVLALADVARAVAEAGDHQHACELLERAEATARAIIEPDMQARALADVASAVVEAGDEQYAHELLERAEAIARTCRGDNEQGAALQRVAEIIAETGDCPWAETIAYSISAPDWQAGALGYAAMAVAKTGDHQRAETIARSAAAADGRAQALAQVARAIAETEGRQRAHGLFEQAESMARSITNGQTSETEVGDQIHQDVTLLCLVRALAEAGEHRWAETIARSITEIARQSGALSSVAQAVAKTGNYEWAETIAGSIANAGDRAVALAAAANAAMDMVSRQRAREILEQAETIARSITDSYARGSAYLSMAGAVAEAGDHQQAREFRKQTETCARCVGDVRQTWLLRDLAGVLTGVGDFRWAETVARSIPDTIADWQAKALRSLAGAIARAGDFRWAETVARSLSEPASQAEAWTFLVEVVAGAGDHQQAGKLLEQAESTARSISNPYWRSRALIHVARAVSGTGDGLKAGELLEQAESMARSIVDPYWRSRTLTYVARAVAGMGDRAGEVLEAAETIARSIANDIYQCEEALVYVVDGLIETGDLQRAEMIARSMTGVLAQCNALAVVAKVTAEAGDYQRAEELARLITYSGNQMNALQHVVETAAQAGEHRKAEMIARSRPAPYQQAMLLAAVARAVAKAGDHQQAQVERMIVDCLRLSHWHHSVEGVVTILPAAATAITTELEILDNA